MNKLLYIAFVAQCACVGLVLCYGSVATSNTMGGGSYMVGYPMAMDYGGSYGGFGSLGFGGSGSQGGMGGIFGTIIQRKCYIYHNNSVIVNVTFFL